MINSQSNQAVQSTQVSSVVAIQEQVVAKKEATEQTKNSSQKVGGAVSVEEIRNAVDSLNSQLENQKIRVNFDVDEDTGRIVVMVKDSETGETLRQVPSEETLEFARNAKKGVGIRVDTTM
jgi:flagellar protein FlaG